MAKDVLTKTSNLVIKGTYFYSAEDLLKKKLLKSGDAINLLHDEGNRFDRWAIEVIHVHSKSKLGYLSRSVSKKYWQLIKHENIVSSEIKQLRQNDGKLLISVSIAAKYQAPKLPSFIKDTDNISAVYLVINNSCKRVYVGSSREVRDRLKSHFTDLAYGWHRNDFLQSDYDSSNLTDFQVVIFAVEDDRAKREQVEAAQIKALLDRNVHLYNMTLDGKGVIRPYTDYECLISISDLLLNSQEADGDECFQAFLQDYLGETRSVNTLNEKKGERGQSSVVDTDEPRSSLSKKRASMEVMVDKRCAKCKTVNLVKRSSCTCLNCGEVLR